MIPDSLNEDQKIAFTKIMETDDFHIIQGFPGCGKTKTIV